MTSYASPRLGRGAPWQTWLLLLVCAVLHYVVLQSFMRHNAYLDQRVLDGRKPFQVALVAERAAEPKADRAPPAALPARPRPRPAVVAKPRATQAPAESADASKASEQTPNVMSDGAATTLDADVAAAGLAGSASGANPVAAAVPTATATAAAVEADAAGASAPAEREAATERAGPLYGVALPAPPSAGVRTYSVHMGDYSETGAAGLLRLRFEHDTTRYLIQAEVNATGLTAWFYGGTRRDVSQGRLTVNGLEPMRYTEQRNRRPERSASVDYGDRTITFAGGETAPAQPGLQDRLSGLFQLGVLARARSDLFRPGQSIEISEMNLRDVQRVSYQVQNREVLSTPSGPLQTLYLVRQGGSANEPRIEVWLDYDAMMLPVRIRLTDQTGRVIDQVIDKKE